jgi:CheY-like chemotaxis protein
MSGRRFGKILVVDDEPDITAVFKRGLQLAGFEVDAYTDPVEALNAFTPGEYELLLTDIKMPNLTGFELYREIRKIDGKIKVAFITAFEIYRGEFEKIFPDIDVKFFITKPVSIDHLGKVMKDEMPKAYDTDA